MLKRSSKRKRSIGPFVLLRPMMETLRWNLPMAIEEHAIPLQCDKLDPVKRGAKKTTFLQQRKKMSK